MVFYLVGIVVFALSSLAFAYTWLKVSAENGEDLVNWPGARNRPSARASLAEHRRRYPGSSLWRWAVGLTASEAALACGLFLGACFHSGR